MGALALDDSSFFSQTDQICSDCGDSLTFCEEIFLLTVNHAFLSPDRELVITPTLTEEGDYAYTPHFEHLRCWEKTVEMVVEEVEDDPPKIPEDSLLFCNCCGSGIPPFEDFLAAMFGELHMSKRNPGTGHRSHFVKLGDYQIMCSDCLNVMNTEVITLWENWTEGHALEYDE